MTILPKALLSAANLSSNEILQYFLNTTLVRKHQIVKKQCCYRLLPSWIEVKIVIENYCLLGKPEYVGTKCIEVQGDSFALISLL